MDGIKLTVGGREIPLKFRMNEFMQIEEEVGNLGEIKDLILSGKKRIRNMVAVIRILGNAGLKQAGEKPDLTDEWLTENMDPYALIAYQAGILACMSRDSASEAEKEKNENEERDLVLEEIDGKKGPVNSHTGG